MHLARGVEGLDIALIDPDKTFEFKVPKYAKHQELESAIEVPLPGDAKAGVMAVTVSSKTLEATTLVIQSDLDVIVKSSRDEVFVFAENMRTGKPWAGVQAADLQRQAGLRRGDDRQGRRVPQKSYKELKDAGDVRVFAVADGNVASNVVGLQGVGVAQGLADKGYIYTDRPAYRAGQMVHVRGCLRHAVGRRLHGREGQEVHARGLRQPQPAGPPGEGRRSASSARFHAHFVLPPTSPQGQYRVLVRDDAGAELPGHVPGPRVPARAGPPGGRYAAPRLLSRRGDRGHDPRGVLLRRPAGRPRDPLPTGRRPPAHGHDRRQGRGPASSCPPASSARRRCCRWWCSLPERNLQTAVNFVLAAQGFSHRRRARCGRSTWPARRSRSRSTTNDAEGKPIAQKLDAQGAASRPPSTARSASGWSRSTRSRRRGRRHGPADAQARQGRPTTSLRAEGHRPLQEPDHRRSTPVQISDDEDHVRLRILADKHTFKVGDTAAVQAPLARGAGPGPGHVPGRPGARLPAGRVEEGRQRARDPDDRASWRRTSSWRWP